MQVPQDLKDRIFDLQAEVARLIPQAEAANQEELVSAHRDVYDAWVQAGRLERI